ncbi:MAG TPA: LytR C-terminal domain-containing protein [Acidimicrobiales bacterium]|nr:LytR C-terminal domain-containing protein [Acidimicrobiales bacterium]
MGRAIAIIVVTVVVGVLVVHSWGSPSVSSAGTGNRILAPSTTTRPRSSPPASTTTTTPHGQVKVLVANDSTTNGVAGGYTTALRNAGWSMLAPVTASPPAQPTSSVYYAANKRDDADVVALALGLPLSSVLPESPATPVATTADTGADVVVVIGSDLAAKTPPSTVPPSSTTTTAPKTSTTH